MRGAAVAVPVNLTVFFSEPAVMVSVPEYEPDAVGANLTVTDPPVLDNDWLEIEKPVPEIDAVGVVVKLAAVILTALVDVLPSTQENVIDVGLRVIVGSGVETDEPPAGLKMSLLSRTRRS